MAKAFLTTVSVLLFASAGCKPTVGPGTTAPVISQTMARFHRPESSTFSSDGSTLFVVSCASGLYGEEKIFALEAGKGAISKLEVSQSGELKMLKPQFVSGLNAPLGITTLPKATGRFPLGTLFVNTGIYILCDDKGGYITDPKVIGTGVAIIDPQTGQTLGKIDMTPGSVVTEAIGDNFPLPNGICFDGEGNLYVTDTGESCGVKNSVMPAKGSGGVVRIDHAAIDGCTQGQPQAGIHFIPIQTPNGVAYNPHADAILVVTCRSGEGETKDSVYSIPVGAFTQTRAAKAWVSGLGNMDGVVVTPAGSVIVSVMNTQSLVKIGKDGTKSSITFDPDVKLFGPSDIKLKALTDGTSMVIVPEQDHLNPDLWQQRVRVVSIPKGY